MLEINKLQKKYENFELNCSMKVEKGYITALVGENGAGKSTLMKILSGTYTNYGGEVLIDGKTVHMKSEKDAFVNGISIVAQELNYVAELSIAENMYIGREPKKGKYFVDAKKRLKDCQTLLDMMGLDYNTNEKMGNLSVSQRQMIEILKSRSRNSTLIIMH